VNAGAWVAALVELGAIVTVGAPGWGVYVAGRAAAVLFCPFARSVLIALTVFAAAVFTASIGEPGVVLADFEVGKLHPLRKIIVNIKIREAARFCFIGISNFFLGLLQESIKLLLLYPSL
jgi:hypothetical protein